MNNFLSDVPSLESNMKSDQDEVLVKLSKTMDPIVSEIDKNTEVERAVFIVATKEMLDDEGEYCGVQTYMDIAGDFGLLQEALASELRDMIEAGNPQLFQALREVVKEIEEEMELDDDTPLLGPMENRTLH